jgi:hypothetical protein
MEAAIEGLPPAAQALLGGVGTGAVGIIIFLWKAYRDYRKDKLQEERDRLQAERDREKVEEEREAARRGRLDRGFGALDDSRDRQITRLTAEAEAAERRHSLDRERWSADLSREREAHQRTAEDRDEGWDRGRGMEQVAHQHRHDFTNLLFAIYSAGRLGAPLPDAVTRTYEAGKSGEPIPPNLLPPPVPPLPNTDRRRP